MDYLNFDYAEQYYSVPQNYNLIYRVESRYFSDISQYFPCSFVVISQWAIEFYTRIK